MKSVLFLAYHFPPMAASGSARPAGFCRHLPEFGYTPIVLSADPEASWIDVPLDNTLLKSVSENLEIHRIDHAHYLDQLLATRERLRRMLGRSHEPVVSKADSAELEGADVVDGGRGLSALKTSLLNRMFLFPDRQKFWRNAVMNKVKRSDLGARADIILATGNPWTSLTTGMLLADKLNVPFVADFRDPWTQNPKPARSVALHQAALRAERDVISRAELVIANTTPLCASFRERYPEQRDKFITITNGYSDEVAELLASAAPSSLSAARPLIDYLGAIYELRKPTELLRAIKALYSEGRLPAGLTIVRFTGHWLVADAACNQLLDELQQLGLVSTEKALPHDEYLSRVAEANNLLILQQDFPLQIPAKIYEYVASGKPVVALCGAGATSELIENFDLGIATENRVNEIKATIVELLGKYGSDTTEKKSPPKEFSYRTLTRKLAQAMNGLVADNNGR